jgi:hypothetical protein
MRSGILSDTALKYGAYSGILSFVIFAAVYFKGYNPLGSSGWLGFWVPILFITLGIIYYRDRMNGGAIKFGEAFRLGFYINLSSAILFVSMVYIFCSLYDPSLVERQKNETLQQLEQSKHLYSPGFYKELVKGIEYITLGSLTTADFFFKAAGGTIVSLIAALILKKAGAQESETQTHSDE